MSTVAEVQSMPAGMPIDKLLVRVKRGYDAREITTQYGKKSKMDLLVGDNTGEIKVTWWEPTTAVSAEVVGQLVLISARISSKGRLSGAVTRHDARQDPPVLEIAATGDHLSLYQPQQHATASDAVSGSSAKSLGRNDSPVPAVAAPISTTRIVPSGPPPESAIYELSERALDAFAAQMRALGVEPEAASLSAMVNTLVIALTNGRLTLEDSGAAKAPF